ncbi:hypothetical protein PFISCL1PPCAC_14011 [Pristionchus fissidentatus]|uniref:Apple domain-containing protein n=1 Tax=Pristionchus fissidentatus TaxID=1538716 RepID=A0AAV5VT22_9BILA|nr:hypothetical protein PFISCL1PPCAC_14011 [Pristionchus fissidentatus]
MFQRRRNQASSEMSLRLVLIVLMVNQMAGVAALTCFAPVTSIDVPTFRHVLRFVTTADNRQQCEFECRFTKKCTAYSFGQSCTLLGYAYSTVSCKVPELIYVAQTTPCPDKAPASIEEDFGTDPCITKAFPGEITINKEFPCTLRDALGQTTFHIIRGIRPNGERVTIDNDGISNITFNAMANMWHYTFRLNEPGGPAYEERLVAAMCVTADDRCPCDALPMTPHAVAGKVPARTGVDGVCANPAHIFRATGFKDAKRAQTAAGLYVLDPYNFALTCRAGMWMVRRISNIYAEFSVRMASCSPA